MMNMYKNWNELKNALKKSWKRYKKIIRRMRLIIIVTCLVLFLLPFILLLVLKLLNLFPGDLLAIPENLTTWFGFYGSYAGCFLSVAIAIITFELTISIQKQQDKAAAREKRFSVITNMPNQNITDCRLYDLSSETPGKLMAMFTKGGDYLFELSMAPAFPPYFKVDMEYMYLKFYDQDNSEVKVNLTLPEQAEYIMRNNNEFKLYIKLSCSKNEEFLRMLKSFYLVKQFGVSDELEKMQLLDVRLGVSCSNVLLKSNDTSGDVQFWMHMIIKNEGSSGTGKGMYLTTIDRNIEYREKEV